MRNIPFGEVFGLALRALRAPEDTSDLEAGGESLRWFDTMTSGGFGTDGLFDAEPRRGRPPLPDEELAIVAFLYDRAMAQGNEPILFVIDETGGDRALDRGRTTQRVSKARRRGFLTAAPAKGVKGGVATDKAMEVIRRMKERTDRE
jgi:hypothetical protein